MFHHRPRDRSGLTRVEAAIILGVAVVCAGLGIIWVEKARSNPGKRIVCTNNLMQLGMAMHNYEATNNGLPTEAGVRPSFYVQLLPFIGISPPSPSVPQYLCPSRRMTDEAPGKRDYGYAASNGASSVGTSVLDSARPLGLHEVAGANGTSNTLLLSHVWMDPQHYQGGDPTDLGWATKNNSRSINDTAKRDSDSSGRTAHIGSVHPNVIPSVFLDCHVANLPYDWPHWSMAWASDNDEPFPLP